MYDIIIIALLLIFFLIGLKKGFVKMLYSALSFVASCILVYFLYDKFSAIFASSKFGEAINDFISANYNGVFSEKLASVAVSVVAILVLYIVIKFLLRLVAGLLNSIAKLPLIRTLNKFLGAVLGLGVGGIWVVLITNVACFIPSALPYINASKIVEAVNIIFVSF